MPFPSATRLITAYLLQLLLAKRLILLDAADCCENTEAFLSVPRKKTDISVCLLLVSVGVKLCWSGEINRMVVRGSYHPWLSGTCLCS